MKFCHPSNERTAEAKSRRNLEKQTHKQSIVEVEESVYLVKVIHHDRQTERERREISRERRHHYVFLLKLATRCVEPPSR